MAGDIDREGVEKAYGRWAPIYDLVFGKVFDEGRRSTIAFQTSRCASYSESSGPISLPPKPRIACVMGLPSMRVPCRCS